jgi:RNA polymerase sigma-70 factor (ECF subfamily)
VDEGLVRDGPVFWPRRQVEGTRGVSERLADGTGATQDWATWTDPDLVAEAAAGSREAFGVLVERHQRNVYRTCFRVVGNHEDAADLAQETLLKAYRGLGRFRRDASFSTWLYRIAVNAALNHVAARGVRSDPLDAAQDLGDPRGEPADAMVERGERARAVRLALSRLPPKQRMTLVLRVYGELSHEEIARTLGRSVGTVKANLFFALRNLRALLGKGEA